MMMAVVRLLQAGHHEQVITPCVPCRVDTGVVGGGRRAPVKWRRGKAKRASLAWNRCDDEEEEERRRNDGKATTVFLAVTVISLPSLPAPARDVLATLRHQPAT